jgi:putative protease
MTAKDIEIMAPVGSFESLMAAIQGGADSVYFGIEHLNMRAKSSNNFTLKDLVEISDICKKNNIHSYITLNTVIYDNELDLMKNIVALAKQNDITAIIASDLSVLQYANSVGISVHISTQCNITNIEAVKFYSSFADTIILARELNLKQVANITKSIEKQQIKGYSGNLIQVEVFAHGALCMAVSGKCYLSLDNENHSANRGDCMQLCRRPYIVTDKYTGQQLEIDNKYIMSAKDLCTIGFLDKILKAGVKVLKIEGRARSPEYVKTVTQCYRKAVDAYFNNNYTKENIEKWLKELKTVYNRGFWDGYYLGKKLGEWTKTRDSQATKKKIYIAKIVNYFSNINVAELKIETNSLSVNDEILITGPTTGVIKTKVKEIRVDLKNVNTTLKGDKCSIPVPSLVRRADKLYKLVDADNNKDL